MGVSILVAADAQRQGHKLFMEKMFWFLSTARKRQPGFLAAKLSWLGFRKKKEFVRWSKTQTLGHYRYNVTNRLVNEASVSTAALNR